MDARLAREDQKVHAIEHGDAGLGQFGDPCRIHDWRNALHLAGWRSALGQVVDGQKRVGFGTAKG